MNNCDQLLDAISQQVQDKTTASETVMIGIRTGGVWVAEAINQRLPEPLELGVLDISFYRDDFTRIGLNPNVQPSNIQFSIEGKTVLLVDDVLYTGRTIRAALNELFDFGRPARVLLCTLIERNGRELPIQADISGTHMQLIETQYIKMHGPEPLQYEIKDN